MNQHGIEEDLVEAAAAEAASGHRAELPPESFQPRIRVPGSRAKTYSARSLFNAFLRHVCSSHSGLGRFARSLFSPKSMHPCSDSTKTDAHGGFPMPLPYPEVFRKGWCGSSRDVSRKKMITVLVLHLNYLVLNRPPQCPFELRAGRRLTQEQWHVVRRLEGFLDAWLDASEVDAEGMGRTAPKIENLEEALRYLTQKCFEFKLQETSEYFKFAGDLPSEGTSRRDAGEVVGESSQVAFSSFKEIEPDRLSFMGFPEFDPRPFLDAAGARVFEFPLSSSLPPKAYVFPIPRVQVHCSLERKIALFTLLDKSRRLALHAPNEVRLRFASGVFSVVKSLTKDRLIMDARPSNLLEIPMEKWILSLASAESLTKLFIPPQHSLRSSGNDLRDFYYLFQASDERKRRNVLAGGVPPAMLQHLSCWRPELAGCSKIYGSLATLAMGDTQAVQLAQTCHVGIGLQSRLISPSNLLTLKGPLPRACDMVGIVIDDLVTLSVCPSEQTKPTAGAKTAHKMQEEYKKVKLIPHEDKAFRDQEEATFWGADVNGSAGTIRGTLKRAIPLMGIILQVCRLGFSTVDLLQIVAGSLVSLFLFRRRLLSLLDAIFQACVGRKGSSIVRMSGRLKGELFLCASMLPLACTNLRADVSPRLVASDASNWGEAATIAPLPLNLAREMIRHTLRKSVWSKLLTPSKAWERSHGTLKVEDELPSPDECYRMNPLWRLLATCTEHSLLFKSRSLKPRHTQ